MGRFPVVMFLYVFETLKMVINPKFILPKRFFLEKWISPHSLLVLQKGISDSMSCCRRPRWQREKQDIHKVGVPAPPNCHESTESLWIEPRKSTYVHNKVHNKVNQAPAYTQAKGVYIE